MAKITVEFLSEAECVERSKDTDEFTQGWWYHAATAAGKKTKLSGNIDSPFWLTQNPKGASQSHGKEIIKCRVLLNRSKHDRYDTKDGQSGLDVPHCWIGVREGTVFIAEESTACETTSGLPDGGVPLNSSKVIRPVREGQQ